MSIAEEMTDTRPPRPLCVLQVLRKIQENVGRRGAREAVGLSPAMRLWLGRVDCLADHVYSFHRFSNMMSCSCESSYPSMAPYPKALVRLLRVSKQSGFQCLAQLQIALKTRQRHIPIRDASRSLTPEEAEPGASITQTQRHQLNER